MRYASVCDGIGSVHVAWKSLGWECVWASEIEPFPIAVVHHNFPEIKTLGDFTTIRPKWLRRLNLPSTGDVDLLVGGTPCQSFSVAGLRGGMDDPRGGLAIEFLRLARRLRPRWLVWENVPGVLSSSGGRDFGSILGGMAEIGYGWAYRILDAQFYGVPQRRRRVFVVGYLGDWRRAAAVLFERQSLSGNDPPNQPTVGHEEWWHGDGRSVPCIDSQYGKKWGSNQWYARGHVILRGGKPSRMTPREVERCFGFPDDYTLVPYHGNQSEDNPRYKALGNSMAVPCMVWIGRRIQAVENLKG